MFFALVNGVHRRARPGLAGKCGVCDEKVTPKCGRIISWHWAHQTDYDDCDHWSEPMSQWHIDWQNRFPASMRENVLGTGEERHRADVTLPDETIIEFQHSSLSVDNIERREKFYGDKLIWVFDAIEAVESGRLLISQRKDDSDIRFRTFTWRTPRKSVSACTRDVYLDLGEGELLKTTWIRDNKGRGFIVSYDEFVKQVGIDETYWEPNPDFIDAGSAEQFRQIASVLENYPRCAVCHRPCIAPTQKTSDGQSAHLGCQRIC